jgi:hypothetical protein
MRNDQPFMGVAIALICGAGLAKSAWFLENTRKGQWFARRFGERPGLWVVRTLLCCGVVFGVLLAIDVIRPIRW